MGWGPALVGGVVGAALGVACHVALEAGWFGSAVAAPWFVIFTGFFVGMGVRLANRSQAGEVNYARGAMAVAITLAAILLTFPAVQYVLKSQGDSALKETAAKRAAAAKEADPESEDAPAEATDKAADAEPVKRRPDDLDAGVGRVDDVADGAGMPQKFNVKMALYMALAALVAYDFGRGVRPRRASEPPTDAPIATDPSN